MLFGVLHDQEMKEIIILKVIQIQKIQWYIFVLI